MKKLALAIALIGASVAASAQTSTTVYGVVDMGLTRDFGSGRTGLDSGLQSGSRLGFKGSEHVGGETTAIFALEAGFNADTGTNATPGNLFNRQAYVGLSGPMGTVKLGRQITPLWSAVDAIDPFASGLAGDATKLFNDGGKRMDNTVNYSNSLFGVLNGQVAYGFGNETAGDYKDGRTVGAAVNFSLGPVYTTAAYHAVDAAGDRSSTTMLGGTLALTKGLKVHGAAADNRGFADHNSRNYLVGVTAVATQVDTFVGSITHRQDRTLDDNDATQYAVGWVHTLSPRTNLYTSYGHVKSDAEPTAKLVNVGIRHKF